MGMKSLMNFLSPTMEQFPDVDGMNFYLTGFRLSGSGGELIGPLFTSSMVMRIVEEFQNYFKRPDIFWMSTGHSVYVFKERFKVIFSKYDVEHMGEVSQTISSMVPPPERIIEEMKAIARRLRVKLYFGLHKIHLFKNNSADIPIGTMNKSHELALQVLPKEQNLVMVHVYSIQQLHHQHPAIPHEEEEEEEGGIEVVPTLEEVWAARDLHAINC